MARQRPSKKAQKRSPVRRKAPADEGVELTDDQLEMVVGGLTLDAWQAIYGGYVHGPVGYGRK